MRTWHLLLTASTFVWLVACASPESLRSGSASTGGESTGGESSGGESKWSHGFRSDDTIGRMQVAVDGEGNVLIAGTLWPPVDRGGGPPTNPTGGPPIPVFVAKFDPGGAPLWSKVFPATGAPFGAESELAPSSSTLTAT